MDEVHVSVRLVREERMSCRFAFTLSKPGSSVAESRGDDSLRQLSIDVWYTCSSEVSQPIGGRLSPGARASHLPLKFEISQRVTIWACSSLHVHHHELNNNTPLLRSGSGIDPPIGMSFPCKTPNHTKMIIKPFNLSIP
jgi:hypothetical protein